MQLQGRARLDLQCLTPAGRVLLDFSVWLLSQDRHTCRAQL